MIMTPSYWREELQSPLEKWYYGSIYLAFLPPKGSRGQTVSLCNRTFSYLLFLPEKNQIREPVSWSADSGWIPDNPALPPIWPGKG